MGSIICERNSEVSESNITDTSEVDTHHQTLTNIDPLQIRITDQFIPQLPTINPLFRRLNKMRLQRPGGGRENPRERIKK